VVDVDGAVEVVVDVGAVVEVVEDGVVVEVEQLGVVVVVVEDVVPTPVLPVFAALLPKAAGPATDGVLASLPPAGGPSAITTPKEIKKNIALQLRKRNLIKHHQSVRKRSYTQ
jgi:hypothetical protein